jgi:hypothetical protein
MFGGAWGGTIRHGASCEEQSLQLRQTHEHWCKQEAGVVGATTGDDDYAAKGWKPNPEPAEERWGGKWGKVCSHNEVVMQALRPFFPQEVLNTRICSKGQPAPGNEVSGGGGERGEEGEGG